ncbi:flagellar P-ring protein precursor FlgI [Albimonas pacifica]|uniref:Flagellar P-ring protein n=2 Tax=Albimonas pacifica TaxID=1114924 RepID=A0A1I3FL39_9RHOB|nr:flagellar P-ring protein precursor FlgI [Albimonas pacifica]
MTLPATTQNATTPPAGSRRTPAEGASVALRLLAILAWLLAALWGGPVAADGGPGSDNEYARLGPSGGPLALGVMEAAPDALRVRLKDLVEFDGVRGNDLVGYGLVVGLNGTGDGLRNAPFTEDALTNLLERLGVNITGEQFRPNNVAAVLVTGVLPPFARAGSQIDVTVSAIGDADSLQGGTLIMTPLNAADGEIYAVAQGSVLAGGVTVQGQAETITQGVPTAGVIPNGARVEREIEFSFDALGSLRLALREPDFTTAARIAGRINEAAGRPIARMTDAGTVQLDLARAGMPPAQLMSVLENLEVAPARRARVVVDQRSGTIVLGDDVRVSRVAISQGNLTLRIRETPIVSQPNPFAPRGAETIVVPRTDAAIEEDPGTPLAVVGNEVTLSQLVEGLNALGVSPRDLMEILKTVKAAGALHAEFIVQ